MDLKWRLIKKVPQILIPTVSNDGCKFLVRAGIDVERDTKFQTELFGRSTEDHTCLGLSQNLLDESFHMTDLLLVIGVAETKSLE